MPGRRSGFMERMTMRDEPDSQTVGPAAITPFCEATETGGMVFGKVRGRKSMSTTGAAVPRLRLRVSAAAQARLRSGHPWLFADSIRDQNRDGRLGELAVIYD